MANENCKWQLDDYVDVPLRLVRYKITEVP